MENSYTTKAQLRTSLQRTAEKIESVENKIDVLSGVADGIALRIDGAEEDISSLQTQVNGINVPTKTSDLTNDSGYPTSVNGVGVDANKNINLTPFDLGSASNTNLLDNWYFSDPINQRGLTEYTTKGYTIDRWRINSNNTKLTVNTDYILLDYQKVSGNGVLTQLFNANDIDAYPGKKFTLSILAEVVSSATNKFFVQLDNNTNTSYLGKNFNAIINQKVLYSFTVTIPATYQKNDSLKFTIYNTDSFEIKIFACKLESGERQTLAHKDENGNWVLNDPPPNKALELAKCQRYFQQIVSTGAYDNIVFGICDSNNRGKFTVPLPTTMRSTPTVSFSGSFKIVEAEGAAFTQHDVTNMSVVSVHSGSLTMNVVTSDTNITVGSKTVLMGAELGALISFDSNL